MTDSDHHDFYSVFFAVWTLVRGCSFCKNTLILLQEPNHLNHPQAAANIHSNLVTSCCKDLPWTKSAGWILITDNIYSWRISLVTRVIKGGGSCLIQTTSRQTVDLFHGPIPCVLWLLLRYCFITVVRSPALSLSEWLITHSHANNHNSICAVPLISPFFNFKTTNCHAPPLSARMTQCSNLHCFYMHGTIKVTRLCLAEHTVDEVSLLTINGGICMADMMPGSICLQRSNSLSLFWVCSSEFRDPEEPQHSLVCRNEIMYLTLKQWRNATKYVYSSTALGITL